MKFQLGAMSLGDILDRGLKILFARLGTFYAIGFLLLLPTLALDLVQPIVFEGNQLTALLVSLIAIILAVVLGQVVAGATILVIARQYVGEAVSVGSAIGYAFSRFGALLGTSIMAGLIIALGLLLFIVPGILFAMSYAVISQVVMLEGQSGGAALSRSSELMKGFRGRVFGLLFVVGLLTGIVIIGATQGLAVAFPPGGDLLVQQGKMIVRPVNYGNYLIIHSVTFLIQVLLQTYQYICITLVYFDLRVRKEGYDLEIAAREQLAPV
jgi:hypothetical protein